MKKTINLVFLIMILLLGTLYAEAAFLPLEESFSENKLPASLSADIPTDFFLEVNDGAVKVSKGSTWNINDFKISASFSPAVISEKTVISFDVCFASGTAPYTPYGFPAITYSNSDTSGLIKFYSGGLYACGSFSDSNKIADFKVENDVTYKFKIILDLENKFYNIYCDSGSGEALLKYSDGTYKFPLSSDCISKLTFTAQSGQFSFNYLTLDNLKIITEDAKYIYVSPEGNDNNIGNKENPLKTPDKAYETAKALKTIDNQKVYVMLMEGDYTLSDKYTYSQFETYKNPGKIVFYPLYGEKVRINGNFIYDLSVLDLSEYESDYILDKFKNYDLGYYKGYPLVYKNAMFNAENSDVVMSAEVLNTSDFDSEITLILCGYTSEGGFKKVAVKDYTALKSSETSVNISLNGEGISYIKAYIWDSFEKMTPLHSAYVYDGEKELSVIALDSSLNLDEAYIKEGNVIISCNETDKEIITLKLTNALNEPVYFDQINLNGAASFKKSVPLDAVSTMSVNDIVNGSYILTIRGVNKNEN